MRVWHGTTKEVMEDVRKRGLVPKGSPGADAWAQEQPGFDPALIARSRSRSVYVTTSRTFADGFAYIAAKQRGGSPIVLEIDLPDEQANASLHEDEASEFLAPLYRCECTILPQWITKEVEPSQSNKRAVVLSSVTGDAEYRVS
jgi:hypothetical protein